LSERRSLKLVKTRKSRKSLQNKNFYGGDMVGEGPQPKVMKKVTLEETNFHNSIKV
jgi:hypothetical protein